tara:strand:- start:777 stop:2288 length:1512 start_codon:yes stop_codon:yes gene_type:complete
MHNLNRYLFGTVFLTGAAVLVLEVAAVRILAPYYGSALYVFSSVLTVILAALSIGYWYGGKRADQKHSLDELYGLIAFSGLLVLALLLAAVTMLPAFSRIFPVSIGPLIFSFGLFFLPAFLLGIVSPYIIKIQSIHTPGTEIGSVVGKTFFWGTLGSIVGSIASGFYLIPTLGVELSIILTSIVLVGVGVVTPLFLDQPLRKKWMVSVLSIVVVFGSFLYLLIQTRDAQYAYRNDGIYSSIAIRDIDIYGQPGRILNRDTNSSSAIFLNNKDLVFDYTQFALLYPKLVPDAKSMLMLGGGAYTIPRTVVEHDPNITVDVVEIEPVLFELAQEYFDLSDISRITNYTEDARVFLNRSDKKYDVIFADLFSTSMAAPFHLTTYEYYKILQERLTPEGVLLLNYAGVPQGPQPSLTGSVFKTISAVFPNTRAFMVRPPRTTKFQNIMVVSRNSDTPLQFPDALTFRSGQNPTFEDMELDLTTYDFTKEYLLTDDFAPVEKLMAKQR